VNAPRGVAGAVSVAVTGLAAVTPVGAGARAFWEALLAGRSGFAPVESFDTGQHSVHVGAEVRGFDAAPFVRRLDAAQVGRASQFAVAAARMALDDAGLDPDGLDPERCGVSIGTTSGEPREIERLNDQLLAGGCEPGAGLVARYPCQVLAAHVASELAFAGPVSVIPNACAAGNHAIAHAADLLRAGRAELMLAGGADAFSRITYTGFARLGAIAPEVCQPFDRRRKGMIPGEGAAVLVLEPLERALRRGARVYAEIAAAGFACDAHHMTASHPEGEGAARAMQHALALSGLGPEDVDYISAHGTGTPTNDRLETISVKRVFGARAARVPMSSVKSMIGHTMGAASAIEAAVCALCIHEGRVPPTMNLHEPDPECDLDYVAGAARELPVRVAMNNAYAFGGNNASLILRRCEV
jgi:3-oxoacyl-[acyl-carrier-protein] synthase II